MQPQFHLQLELNQRQVQVKLMAGAMKLMEIAGINMNQTLTNNLKH